MSRPRIIQEAQFDGFKVQYRDDGSIRHITEPGHRLDLTDLRNDGGWGQAYLRISEI